MREVKVLPPELLNCGFQKYTFFEVQFLHKETWGLYNC